MIPAVHAEDPEMVSLATLTAGLDDEKKEPKARRSEKISSYTGSFKGTAGTPKKPAPMCIIHRYRHAYICTEILWNTFVRTKLHTYLRKYIGSNIDIPVLYTLYLYIYMPIHVYTYTPTQVCLYAGWWKGFHFGVPGIFSFFQMQILKAVGETSIFASFHDAGWRNQTRVVTSATGTPCSQVQKQSSQGDFFVSNFWLYSLHVSCIYLDMLFYLYDFWMSVLHILDMIPKEMFSICMLHDDEGVVSVIPDRRQYMSRLNCWVVRWKSQSPRRTKWFKLWFATQI